MLNKYNKQYFKGLEKSDITELPRNIRNLEEIKKCKNSGKLLDVGIGTGSFLRLAQKSGFDVLGVDISDYTVKKVREKFNLAAVKGELTKIDFRNERFDVINMRHTIEHIKKPVEALKKAYKLLKPGGIIYISTPNSFGVHARIYGREWPHWSYPYHLHFFSKKTLSNLILNAGLEITVLKTEEITIYNSIYAIFKKTGITKKLYNPGRLSRFVDNFLAKIGLGEGLVLIARKG